MENFLSSDTLPWIIAVILVLIAGGRGGMYAAAISVLAALFVLLFWHPALPLAWQVVIIAGIGLLGTELLRRWAGVPFKK